MRRSFRERLKRRVDPASSFAAEARWPRPPSGSLSSPASAWWCSSGRRRSPGCAGASRSRRPLFSGATEVEGVRGRRVDAGALSAAGRDAVLVAVDPDGACLGALRPDVLVDGRMAKRNLGTRMNDAPLVIGLGPGLAAGVDVHAVVETQRGPDLGGVCCAANGSGPGSRRVIATS